MSRSKRFALLPVYLLSFPIIPPAVLAFSYDIPIYDDCLKCRPFRLLEKQIDFVPFNLINKCSNLTSWCLILHIVN